MVIQVLAEIEFLIPLVFHLRKHLGHFLDGRVSRFSAGRSWSEHLLDKILDLAPVLNCKITARQNPPDDQSLGHLDRPAHVWIMLGGIHEIGQVLYRPWFQIQFVDH